MIEIELIVGTLGLEKILADKLPKYSQSLLTKAGSTLKTFKAGAKEFAEKNNPGSLPDEQFGLEDFKDLSLKLQMDQDITEAIEGLATWPTEMQTEIMVLIADIKVYLGQQLPQQQVTGTFSGSFIDPSDSDKFRFLWQANLVNDIRGFVDLLNSGSITPIESALLRTLFPQTHDYLVIEVMDKVLDAAIDGSVETWEGTWRKPALSGLLGIPIMNFSDIGALQSGFAEKTVGRPKGPGAIQMAGVNLSENDRMEAKTLDKSKL